MSLISSDGLSLDAPGIGWKSVGVDPLVVWSLATLAAGNSLEFLGEICTPGRLLWPRTRLLARSQEQSFELVFSKAKHWKFTEVIKVYLRNSRSSLIVVILVHWAGWCCKEVDTLEKDLQSKNKTLFLPWTRLREKTFKMRLRLERLSSWLRRKLFQGQTVEFKFLYLGRSRFLCYQQREPGHLGSMPQENMQRTTNLLFLWIIPTSGRWQW